METLQVGQPYIPGRTHWPEQGEYNYYSGQHELRLFWESPSADEVRAVRKGAAHFALFVEGPVIVMLYQFAGACDWSDAPYSIHLVPQEHRTAPPVSAGPETRALMQVLLVDAATGVLRAIRAITLSPPFTAALHRAIDEQHRAAWDSGAYDQALQALYAKYLHSSAMVRAAVIVERGGL